MSERNESLDHVKELGESEADNMAKRALVVDRSAMARSAISILLQRMGWEAIGAADGAEAVMLASAWHFDLILTVPHPSKVPGLQLVGLLKGNLLSPTVWVVLLVEDGEWIGEVENFADAILVKNNGLEKHLHGLVAHLFEGDNPDWAQCLSDDSSSRQTLACKAS